MQLFLWLVKQPDCNTGTWRKPDAHKIVVSFDHIFPLWYTAAGDLIQVFFKKKALVESVRDFSDILCELDTPW